MADKKMRYLAIAAILFIFLAAVGCSKKIEQSAQEPALTDDSSVSDISADITEADSLEKELNSSEIADVESDLNSIDW